MVSDVLTFAVVVIGKFAPGMFHPSWLERFELVGKEAAAASMRENIFISEDRTNFFIDGMDILVLPDRIQIASSREDAYESIRDLMRSILVLLDVTPVTSVGLNWTKHFKVSSEAKWHALGDRFAPKSFWNTHWNGHAGLLRLSVRLERTDARLGSVNVVVEPSSEITPGVYVKINDHFEIDKSDAAMTSKLVDDVWAASKEAANGLISAIQKDAENE